MNHAVKPYPDLDDPSLTYDVRKAIMSKMADDWMAGIKLADFDEMAARTPVTHPYTGEDDSKFPLA